MVWPLWKFVAVGACAVVGMVAAPLLAKAGLGAIGFGAAGPVAYSTAAGMQSSIGNVAAGSLFATAQSLAMGGGAILMKIITAFGAFIGGKMGADFF